MHAIQTIDDAEVIAFHWHPAGKSDVTDPHMHVGSTQLNPGGRAEQEAPHPGPRGIAPEAVEAELREAGIMPAEHQIAWADSVELPEVQVDLRLDVGGGFGGPAVEQGEAGPWEQ
jgi:hypothetical protein